MYMGVSLHMCTCMNGPFRGQRVVSITDNWLWVCMWMPGTKRGPLQTSALSLALGFETGSHCVDQIGLELREMTLLLLSIPGQRHVGPYLVQRAFLIPNTSVTLISNSPGTVLWWYFLVLFLKSFFETRLVLNSWICLPLPPECCD